MSHRCVCSWLLHELTVSRLCSIFGSHVGWNWEGSTSEYPLRLHAPFFLRKKITRLLVRTSPVGTTAEIRSGYGGSAGDDTDNGGGGFAVMARGRHRFRLVEDLGWRCAKQSFLSLVRLTGSLRGVNVDCWLACELWWCVYYQYRENGVREKRWPPWFTSAAAAGFMVWPRNSETSSPSYLVPLRVSSVPPQPRLNRMFCAAKRNGENETKILT